MENGFIIAIDVSFLKLVAQFLNSRNVLLFSAEFYA